MKVKYGSHTILGCLFEGRFTCCQQIVTVGLFPDLSSSVLYQEFLLEGKAFLTGKKHGMFPRPQEESDFQSHTDIVLVQLQTYVQALSAI